MHGQDRGVEWMDGFGCRKGYVTVREARDIADLGRYTFEKRSDIRL